MRSIHFHVLHIAVGFYCRFSPIYSQVFQVSEANFDKLTRDKDIMLIAFYMPWCKHCQTLLPEWDTTEKVLEQNREYILGKVNCWEDGKTLCDKLDIQMYPDIRLYRHGKYIESYEGERNAEMILDFIQRAQTTTGKVGSTPFWEKAGQVPVNTPPVEQVPTNSISSGLPSAIPAYAQGNPQPPVRNTATDTATNTVTAQGNSLPSPSLSPQFVGSAKNTPKPKVKASKQAQTTLPLQAPPPILPPYQLPFQSASSLSQVSSEMSSPVPIETPPFVAQPQVFLPASPPYYSQDQNHVATNVQERPELPVSPHDPHLTSIALEEPGHPTQWSTPVNPMNLAYNLAVSQQDTPGNFWNNVKFWHDFLSFINSNGPPAFHHPPFRYPQTPVYIHNPSNLHTQHAGFLHPESYSSEYQHFHPTPGYPVQYSNDLDNHNILRTETTTPFNAMFRDHQLESSSILGNPVHCQLRHNCPGLFSAKTPIYYLPPVNPLRGLMGPNPAAPIHSLLPLNYESAAFIGVTRSLNPSGKKLNIPTQYIKPSVYKLLKRKKPLERFMKRPIVQGRFTDPLLLKIMERRVKVTPNKLPIARTMTQLTKKTLNQIKALRAQYEINHPRLGVPLVGSAMLRKMPQNPFLRASFNPYSPSKILPRGVPWNLSLQPDIPNYSNPGFLSSLKKEAYKFSTPSVIFNPVNRKLPLLKKTILPSPLQRRRPTMVSKQQYIPLRPVVVQGKIRQAHSVGVNDPSLVGIWDKIYRFYAHKGSSYKFNARTPHEVQTLKTEETPKGIATVEKFLEKKFSTNYGKKSTKLIDTIGSQHDLKIVGKKMPFEKVDSDLVKSAAAVVKMNPKNNVKYGHMAKKNNNELQEKMQGNRLKIMNISKEDSSDKSKLKAISLSPHSWDKRGKVTFAISKKTNIPGKPRVTGVWGTLKKRKKRKSRKKRSFFELNCHYVQKKRPMGISHKVCVAREVEYG